MASESWSAFTLQATRSWAVEAATCLADEMSFSSLAWPCTAALAASHRLLVAAATRRACGKRGCQGGSRSPDWLQGGCGAWDGKKQLPQHVGKGGRSMAASSTEEKQKGRASSCLKQESRGRFPPQPLSMTLILTAEMRPWDHCPSSTALAGMAPTYEEGGEE